MRVVQFHCDECGKFVPKNHAVIKRDQWTGKELIYCSDCFRGTDQYKGKIYTQELLRV